MIEVGLSRTVWWAFLDGEQAKATCSVIHSVNYKSIVQHGFVGGCTV